MKSREHIFSDLGVLVSFLKADDMQNDMQESKSVLVQIFSSQNAPELIEKITETIHAEMRQAQIIGTTTVGEISSGHLEIGQIIITFSFLEQTGLTILAADIPDGEEANAGKRLKEQILQEKENTAGILIYATPLTIDLSVVLDTVYSPEMDFPFFGGGAGVYDTSRESMVFYNNRLISKGLVAVLFIGKNLQIQVWSELGWKPLGKEMTITQAEGRFVHKINNHDAFGLYKRYLNIENNSSFFQNVLEFPFLVSRNGVQVARVPFFAHQDNSIEFIADIQNGEKFSIGYGDPDTIIQKSREIQQSMTDFQPDEIFIFACICRRFLMQEDVNLEIQPFQDIAPTAGFFTYGEFCSGKDGIQLMNAAIVVVGMREGSGSQKEGRGSPKERSGSPKEGSASLRERSKTENRKSGSEQETKARLDLYSDMHHRIVSRLLHFIGRLTEDLENANSELRRISETDALTGICNRMKLDMVLFSEIGGREGRALSVMILDIDRFKEINDRYGHLTGDKVLSEFALVLSKTVRKKDVAGRWGGEEFMVIMPELSAEEALNLAENILETVRTHFFEEVSHLTCSAGIAEFCQEDSPEDLVHHADLALYRSKREGRDRVSFFPEVV